MGNQNKGEIFLGGIMEAGWLNVKKILAYSTLRPSSRPLVITITARDDGWALIARPFSAINSIW